MLKKGKIEKILKPHLHFTMEKRALCFLPGNCLPEVTAGHSFLGQIQDILKRNGKFYNFLVKVFAPVWVSSASRRMLSGLLRAYGEDKIVLNLGSGPTHCQGRTDIINIDLFAFDEVDVVADISELPFEDNSVDLILSSAILEHVEEPKKVVSEIFRVLKSGGEMYCYAPFMVPYHAAPGDYHRWTVAGVRKLFDRFEHLEVGIGAGPTSGMLWVLQEWIATVLSLGSATLHDCVFGLLMILTAPIKLFDMVLERLPFADKIASGFCVLGKKP